MLNFIHRGTYIMAICFFISIGLILILIGSPNEMKNILGNEVFKMIYTSETPQIDVVAITCGVLVSMLSILIGIIGGAFCRFGKKVIIPKRVNVLRAQDSAVFIVDGKVFKKNEAAFYNLEDLSRIRLFIIKNLYYMELRDDIAIAPEKEIVNEKEILHRDNEKISSQRDDASNENREDRDTPFK